MADEKRPSARQVPASGPAMNRTSGRSTVPVAAAAKPSGSGSRAGIPAAGPRPGSSRRAPVVVEEELPPPPPPPAPARVSGPQRRSGLGTIAKKKPKLPMKEILIAAGILFSILAIALIVGYVKTGKKSEVEEAALKQTQIMERNVKFAADELKKAVDVGTLFSVGKDTIDPKDPSKLFAPFKGNSKIYNVIYNRDYKDKKQTDRHEQFALVDDLEHRTINELNKAIPEEKDMSIKYALARDKDVLMPVIVAKKIVHPAKEDPVNTGGQIMVIVMAEEDDFLKKAIQKVSEGPRPESTPVGTTAKAPAAPTAPADPKTK